MTLRLASTRGPGHRYEGRPREDDVAAFYDADHDSLVFAVADGVSDASDPHVGAALACRSAVDEALRQIALNAGVVDWGHLLRSVAWQLVEHAAKMLGAPEPDPAAAEGMLASTLIAGVARPVPGGLEVVLARVGDSSAWTLEKGRFTPLYANDQPLDIVSTEVVALPRVPSAIEVSTVLLPWEGALVVATDGFADPLADGKNLVGDFFAEHLATPPNPHDFAYLLDFSRESFEDDRTMLAIWAQDRERD
ncbi:protein phosphatase 2C domain-containing protein [Streptomyces sp. WAC04114]|uniref:protein phosphatase 2C domain-containing protein n=1 Tax=Streptomyces sp. WAC04114 TaxID=2867961 RepID=UPI001C8B7D71|nr:protein phosphatase 2C domain-containing protein [Streptomyces sp. WAC04114]MBX9363202.1 protein phosphatase 2C domain-containing protein [Streptomyces sp. WAC04114]